MSINKLRFLIAFLACSFAVSAYAQFSSGYLAISAFAAPPDPGMYYNPEEPGNGYGIDIDSNGSVFVAWYTYRADGVPVWYTMSGNLERAPAQTLKNLQNTRIAACTNVPLYDQCLGDKVRFFNTGVLSRVTSPVYAVVNGACPTCPPRFPAVSESALGPATIVWVGNRSAVLTFQGRSVAIQRQDIATPVTRLIENVNLTGVMIIASSTPPQQGVSISFTARFTATTIISAVTAVEQYGVSAPDLSALNLTAPTTRLYLGAVVYGPGGANFNNTDTLVIAIDTKNNRAYLLKGLKPPGGIPTGGASFELKVNEYGELFVYGDRMISWIRIDGAKPTFGLAAGIIEYKFAPIVQVPQQLLIGQ